jgi:RNA ligase
MEKSKNKISMKYEDLKPYLEQRLIREEAHPNYSNIRIFNYLPELQFSNKWDDVNKLCRGLIMDVSSNEIIARPLKKFFNWQEHIEQGLPIPNETPLITEKIDGSLIIHSKINGKDCLSTRGSFISNQAIWATNWWNENIKENIYKEGWTHLFEVVFPQNIIVVRYDFSGLVYLGSINNITGQTFFFPMPNPIRVVKAINNNDFTKLLEMDGENEEGFVIHFPISDLRLKIKFPQYVKLHRVVTGMSEIAIWEMLKEGKSISELINNCPDEFFKWVESVANKLTSNYSEIEKNCKEITAHAKTLTTRKEQALYITQFKNSGVCFKMLDNEDYSEVIWKTLKPKGATKI